MTWVTVARVFNPAEAELVRSRLEAAGLCVNLTHELAGLALGSTLTTGGVRVQVPEDVAEEARALIASKDTEGA
ncbi:MAG: DUF2007 domain-containing protein [Verrucomicrobia bacterium]|nr:DUF2007 domain-containing protein [Verrucomicrobiota bacterium]